MICYEQLQSSDLQLRCLREEDITERYVAWLNDPEITQYLEVRFQHHTLNSTREFVHSVNASRDSILFGMFVNGGRWHIGNIKLGPVNPHHRRAEISLMIGDRCEWGKGFATLAISLVTAYGFDSLRLRKIMAGCYSNNFASLKAFEKVGYEVEGRLLGHWQTAEGTQDQVILSMMMERHAELGRKRVARRFGFVRKLVFIGGGDLMIETVKEAIAQRYEVRVIMAPRHADEMLPLTALNARQACAAVGANVAVIEDINAPGTIHSFAGHDVLALCFGPAWIFSSAVIATFGAGMINFNGIPIPHYLGGAHYTWQILNGNRQGGCFLQDITAKIDRGDILRAEKFKLPEDLATPHDYFAANHLIGVKFMRQALADFRNDREFMPTPFGQVNSGRLYFPRLLTKYNAWIDWKWSGREIMLFCQAFDDPYLGAATYLHGNEVRLKKVTFKSDEGGANLFHSYVAGLIVRQLGGSIWIAVPDGLLRAEFVADAKGLNILPRLKEGDRFATPPDVLHQARTRPAVVSTK